jgi:hypothetical protein
MRDPGNSIARCISQAAQQCGSIPEPPMPVLSPHVSDRWSYYALCIGAMLGLAGLDFIGSFFAKEWTLHHHPGLFLAGLVSFVILYVVFTSSLRIAELSVVGFGWIVFLQVGLVLLDRMRYGVIFPPGKWVAIVLLFVLQAYLVLAPNVARQADVV